MSDDEYGKDISSKIFFINMQRIFLKSSFSPTALPITFFHYRVNLTKHTFSPSSTWHVLVAEIARLLPGFQMFSVCFWARGTVQTCLYSYLTQRSVKYMKRKRAAVIDVSKHCHLSVFDCRDCVLSKTDIYEIFKTVSLRHIADWQLVVILHI